MLYMSSILGHLKAKATRKYHLYKLSVYGYVCASTYGNKGVGGCWGGHVTVYVRDNTVNIGTDFIHAS
jgi:hypothetical protein